MASQNPRCGLCQPSQVWRAASGCVGSIGRPHWAETGIFMFQSGAAIMVVIYSQFTDATALLIAGTCMGVFVNGMLGGYGALISDLYPTEARATAQNVLFNLGRAVGGFGPLVIGALATQYSFAVA